MTGLRRENDRKDGSFRPAPPDRQNRVRNNGKTTGDDGKRWENVSSGYRNIFDGGFNKAGDLFTYDAEGRMLTRVIETDGVVTISTWTRDSDGRPLTVHTDDNGDGVSDSITSYTYDENGSSMMTWDTDADGVIDHVRYFTRDENGQLLLLEDDADNDGVIDYIKTYTYDEDGNTLTSQEDNDANGVIDFSRSYTWDCI